MNCNHFRSKYSADHLQIIRSLLSPSTTNHALDADDLRVCQAIASHVLAHGLYKFLSEATLRIVSKIMYDICTDPDRLIFV